MRTKKDRLKKYLIILIALITCSFKPNWRPTCSKEVRETNTIQAERQVRADSPWRGEKRRSPFVGASCLERKGPQSGFKEQSWQHEVLLQEPNILLQFFPDQNAYRLFRQIPSDLLGLSYAIYPISHGYDTARFNDNKRFNIFPYAIFAPRTEHEIIYVLSKLKKHHLPFSIRSGGHCFEPGSLSSGYVIDLRNFNTIRPDVQKKEVYIGAGCKLGSVITALGKRNYAIPTGTCPSVGITGLALGGGLGPLSRLFGPTCDSIKSITLLTAEGKIIEVTKKHHSDLFWALRGAGNGSYGIVLGFTFKMYYIPAATTVTLTWNWDPATVQAVFQAWQAWVQTLKPTVTTQLNLIYNNKTLSITVGILNAGKGSFSGWQTAFSSLQPQVQIIQGPYLKSAALFAANPPNPFYKAKSEFIFQPLSQEPIQSAISFLEEFALNQEDYVAVCQLYAMGGAIRKGNNAFFPKKAFGWWHQTVFWDRQSQQELALEKLRKFKREIAPFVSPYSYVNYVDYDIGKKYLRVYYGNEVHRLIRIKRKYDPHNLFHWKQSIPVHCK